MKKWNQAISRRALMLTVLLSSPAILALTGQTAAAAPLAITSVSPLPQGTVGTPYAATVSATGGTAPLTWTVVPSNGLPPGLTLAPATGLITGTPTTPGLFGFFLQVTDSTTPIAASTFKTFTLTVVGTTALSITTPATLPAGMVGTAYSQTLASTGGTAPYAWSLASGALPSGLGLSSSGVISGTPTASGTYTFSGMVTDSLFGTAAVTFSLTINTAGPLRSGVLSQVASGGGWKTSLYLVNASATSVPVVVKFWSNTGTQLSLPLSVTQLGGTQISTGSSVNATVTANSTLLVESTSSATTETTGWAEVIATGNITGYGVFHYTSLSGDQSEGTLPLEATFQPTFILPYDGVGGFSSGVALTNLVTTQTIVTATAYNENGGALAAKTITLPSNGHTAFALLDQFPSTISHRGIIEFKAPVTANITGLGLRINPEGGFTSIPLLHRP